MATIMARSLYRLMECEFDGGSEWTGWFSSDKEAIATFIATFKEHEKFQRKNGKKLDDWYRKRCLEKGEKFRRIGVLNRKREWMIQRLGYMKPGTAVEHVPWKTVYVIQKGDE
jgi:hypothetical protein